MNHSKQISYILRHHPESVGLTLDANGWVSVEKLCLAVGITYDELVQIVWTNNKQRFEFDVTGELIRARQGHSISVDLGLKPVEPPAVLYHGTKEEFMPLIRVEGIRAMSRQFVQLSESTETAQEVARRRKGKSTLLTIAAHQMYIEGYEFFRSANNVWTTRKVPPKYLSLKT